MIENGRKLNVENASGVDMDYDGRHLTIETRHPINQNWIKLRFYVSPVPLSFDFIIGCYDMRLLGFRTIVMRDCDTAFNYKYEMEAIAAYDVHKELDADLYDQMNYFGFENRSIKPALDFQSNRVNFNRAESISIARGKSPKSPNAPQQHFVDDAEEMECELEELLDLSDYNGIVATHIQEEIKDILRRIAKQESVNCAERMKAILCKYYRALATDRWDIGCIDGYEYRIPLKPGAKPIYTMPYNLSQPDLRAALLAYDVKIAGILEAVGK